jgi:hypothetical protein
MTKDTPPAGPGPAVRLPPWCFFGMQRLFPVTTERGRGTAPVPTRAGRPSTRGRPEAPWLDSLCARTSLGEEDVMEAKILLQHRGVALPRERKVVAQVHSIKRRVLPSGKVTFDAERTTRGAPSAQQGTRSHERVCFRRRRGGQLPRGLSSTAPWAFRAAARSAHVHSV